MGPISPDPDLLVDPGRVRMSLEREIAAIVQRPLELEAIKRGHSAGVEMLECLEDRRRSRRHKPS